MKKISLTQGKFALVDDEDYEYINQWKWCYNNGYAVRGKYIGTLNGKEKTIIVYMHRIINKTPDGLHTDHISMDRLNNQKNNLRDCTVSQNHMNLKSYKNSSSKFKGVNWDKNREKWYVKIIINKKHTYLGRFSCEIEAAKAYNKAATENFGEFAKLNDI